jgi:hypothetical protein
VGLDEGLMLRGALFGREGGKRCRLLSPRPCPWLIVYGLAWHAAQFLRSWPRSKDALVIQTSAWAALIGVSMREIEFFMQLMGAAMTVQ